MKKPTASFHMQTLVSTKSIPSPLLTKQLTFSNKLKKHIHLFRVQLRCICDLDIPLLLYNFVCRQCWNQRFSTQSSELLQTPSRGFWETWLGSLPSLRWSLYLRHSPRWRRRGRCCHFDSRSLQWNPLLFLAPWWKKRQATPGSYKKSLWKNNLMKFKKTDASWRYTDLYLRPAQSSRHDQWLLCEQFIEMCMWRLSNSTSCCCHPPLLMVKDKREELLSSF